MYYFVSISWIHGVGSGKPCLCTEICSKFQKERSSTSHSCEQCRNNVSTLWDNWRWFWAAVWSKPSRTICSDKSALSRLGKVSKFYKPFKHNLSWLSWHDPMCNLLDVKKYIQSTHTPNKRLPLPVPQWLLRKRNLTLIQRRQKIRFFCCIDSKYFLTGQVHQEDFQE